MRVEIMRPTQPARQKEQREGIAIRTELVDDEQQPSRLPEAASWFRAVHLDFDRRFALVRPF
jgi:hypothetical protein